MRSDEEQGRPAAMPEAPLVSIVIPVFNSARFLPEALACVARQTYAKRELILVDGPSTDETPRIARSFPGARYMRQTGEGMWNALNEGIEASRGELISIFSDDDLWIDDKLRLQVEALSNDPGAEYAAGRVKFVTVAGEQVPPSFRRELLEGDYIGFMPELLLVRRRLFDRLGRFDEARQLAADIDWIDRLREAEVGSTVVPQVLLFKRMHAANLSVRASSGAILNREILQIIKRKVARRRSRDCE